MRSIISLVLFFVISTIQAQTVKVLDAETQEPIVGVLIYAAKVKPSVSTNLKGEATLDVFLTSEIIVFQSLGYQSVKLRKTEIIKSKRIVYLQPKLEGLDQVLISASKFEQSKRDIPQAIAMISASDIIFENPQTSADLLENSGNVYVQKSQLGGGSPMIRGFSTNRLLITVDGVRMNTAIFRGGNLQNVISIDPFTIQSTEITLGAGQVVYGSDAIGGVMSFYSKKPKLSYKDTLQFNANAIARYASATKEKTGHLDFNFGLHKWAFLSSISYSDFDDLKMGSHGPNDYLRPEYVKTVNGADVIVENADPRVQNPTGYDQVSWLQKVRYQPGANLNFDLGLFYTTTSEYARYDRLIRYRNNQLRSAEWKYGPQRWFMGNLQISQSNSKSHLYDEFKVTLAYQNFKESRIDRDFESEIRNSREENVHAYSINLDFEKHLSEQHQLFYGVEYVYNLVNSSGEEENIETNVTIPTVSRYPDASSWQSLAAYASYKYKPADHFVFQTGLRYNHILIDADFTKNNAFLNLPFDTTKINAGALTGTAGLSWSPNRILQWRLNGSTAFRAPNIDDVGKVFDSEPGAVVVPNANLKPEYAYGGELGLRLNFNEVFALDMATYYTYLDNALVRRDFSLNGETQIIYDGELSKVQAIQNASSAHIYGFEVGMAFNFTKSFKLTSKYNVIGGSEQEDNGVEVPVRHVSPNFGNTHLIWDKQKFKIDAFVEFNNELSFNQLAPSEREKDYIYALNQNNEPYAPSWYTLNLRTQYQFNKALTITGSLENISDQRYRTYSSGIAAPGRNLILSLNYKF